MLSNQNFISEAGNTAIPTWTIAALDKNVPCEVEKVCISQIIDICVIDVTSVGKNKVVLFN